MSDITQILLALKPFAQMADGYYAAKNKYIVIVPQIVGDPTMASDFDLNAQVTVEDLRFAKKIYKNLGGII